MSDAATSPARPEPASAAVQRAWIELMRGQRHVFEAIEDELRKSGFPPLTWYDVLLELDRAEGGRLRPFEIAKHTLFAQPNLSRLIDRLQREGLVERRAYESDRRGQWIQITVAGRAKRRAMWAVYGAAMQKHFGAKLGERDAALLARLLGRLLPD